MVRRCVAWVVFLFVLLLTSAAFAQATDKQKEEAQSHFDLGISHFDRDEWPAALAEFLRSRELYKSRGNTKNAAICLRKVGRYDEALEMFQTLLRDFPELSAADRALAQKEVNDLQASVGTIAVEGGPPDATVIIDAVERGKTPLKGPVRLSAGSHLVRVTKDGSLPFEKRVDLVGRQAVVVQAQLIGLTQVGRLRVAEHESKPADVVVDGAVVGKTPWEGALAPGDHAVFLKGEGEVGTAPVLAKVKLNEVVTLDLSLVILGSKLRVVPDPAAASVAIDDVPVGNGAWEGRLAVGPHKVAVILQGYEPFSRELRLEAGDQNTLDAPLVSMAVATGRSGVSVEMDLGTPLALLIAGVPGDSDHCKDSCSSSTSPGFHGVLHGEYELSNGIGLGIHAGYLLLPSKVTGRQAEATSAGALNAKGTVDDDLLMRGLVAGIDGQFRTRGDWPITARLGVGVFIGSTRDKRSGTLAAQQGGNVAVGVTQSASTAYLYVAPEVRIGRRLSDHFTLNLGVAGLIMPALSAPKWNGDTPLSTGADGQGKFPSDRLLSNVIVAIVPSVGLAYDF